MTKFKIGDKVRVTDKRRNQGNGIYFTHVLEGEVTTLPTEDYDYYHISEDTTGWSEYSLESLFKVGDRVRGESPGVGKPREGVITGDPCAFRYLDTEEFSNHTQIETDEGHRKCALTDTMVPVETPGFRTLSFTNAGESTSQDLGPLKDALERYAQTLVKQDVVNSPNHYTSVVPGIECIDVVKHFPFAEGNAIKYIWRAGVKDKATRKQDLQKAIKNLQFAIAKIDDEGTE